MGMTFTEKITIDGKNSLIQRFRNVIVPGIKVAVRQLGQSSGQVSPGRIRSRLQTSRFLENGDRSRVCAAILQNFPKHCSRFANCRVIGGTRAFADIQPLASESLRLVKFGLSIAKGGERQE